MTELWSIIVPELVDVDNLVTNPSIETATTGYTAVGGSVARDTTKSRRGAASLKITPTAGTGDGAYYGTVALTSGQSYTASVDVYGVDNIPYQLYFATTGGAQKGTPTTFTGKGRWKRHAVTWIADATASFRIYVVKNNHASTGDFWIDGLLCANLDHDTSYHDGDSIDCRWLGAAHASKSRRSGQSRRYGEEINLATFGFRVLHEAGIGAPSGEHQVLDQALLAGALFQDERTIQRAITLTLAPAVTPTDAAALHSLRNDLLEAVKPDLVSKKEPFWLRYSGAHADRPVQALVHYDSGLEYDVSAVDDWTAEEIPFKCIAYDPYWYEDGEAAVSLTANQSITDADYVIAKIGGVFGSIGTGANGNVYALAEGPDGSVYIGGGFTTLDGVTVNYIAKYDPATDTASALSSGLNGTVRAIAVGPDGAVYVGGEFTDVSGGPGGTYNRVIKWTGSAWAGLGTGLNNTCYALIVAADGKLYAGGAFTTAGGGAAQKIASWDGSAWAAVGAGLNGNVLAFANGPDGYLYIGGAFTDISGGPGNTYDAIICWSGSAYSAVGTNDLNQQINALAFAPDGTLYAAGSFSVGSEEGVGMWRGGAWSIVGGGVQSGQAAYAIAIDPERNVLYVGGQFSWVGSSLLSLNDRIAQWNGSRWAHFDVDLPGSPTVYALLQTKSGDLYVGFSTSGTGIASYTNTVNNPNTRAAYPKIVVKRTGGTSATLAWIRNETTGATLWFDYDLLDGETLTIDLTPGGRQISSSFFGDIWRALIRGSDLASWRLQPGNNQVSLLVSTAGGAASTQYMLMPLAHWSADGVAA